MRCLFDTHVLSELRKGARADGAARQWFAESFPCELYSSVLTLGEIRSGIERIRTVATLPPPKRWSPGFAG